MSEPLIAFPVLLRLAQFSSTERAAALQQLNDLDLAEIFGEFGAEVTGRMVQAYANAYPEHPDDDLEPVCPELRRPAPAPSPQPPAPDPSRSWADASQDLSAPHAGVCPGARAQGTCSDFDSDSGIEGYAHAPARGCSARAWAAARPEALDIPAGGSALPGASSEAGLLPSGSGAPACPEAGAAPGARAPCPGG